MAEMGPWDGERAALEPGPGPRRRPTRALTLAAWKQLLDDGRMQDGDDNLRATARMAVARVSSNVYDALGAEHHGHRRSRLGHRCRPPSPTWPTTSSGCPANSTGRGLLADLGLARQHASPLKGGDA